MGICQSSPPRAPKSNQFAIFFPDDKMPCRNYNTKTKKCSRSPCPSKGRFACYDTNLTKFLDVLGSAKNTLDICVYTITCNEISACIKDVMKAGVKVRIITDDENIDARGSDIKDLARAGAHTLHDNSTTLMHHKFCVIDSKILMSGSFNWTRSAVLQNRENVVVSDDVDLVLAFQNEFSKMFKLYNRKSHLVHTTKL
eukprot:m.265339 g.265339  ORF g.265339 m.265339 type:complete len:198 (-) comp61314_c0_seq1:90-683(-)